MKIERVVCSNETHEVVLCKGSYPHESGCTPEGTIRWYWVEYGRGHTDDEQAAYVLSGGGFPFECDTRNLFDQDAIVALRPKGALPRPESETPAVDLRDARIAELEAALAAEKARADAAEATLEAVTIDRDHFAMTSQEGVEILAEERRRLDAAMQRNTEVLRWKASAQRIANCAVSVIEYLQTDRPDEPYPDEVDRAALAGVELVLAALREMQS